MVDAIPFTELRNAMMALNLHVVHQLRNAVDRYHNHKKPEALFFAIIAFEELMKLSTYVDCYNQQKGLSVEEHKKLFDHKKKLTRIPSMVSSLLANVSEEDYKLLLNTYDIDFSNTDQSRKTTNRDTEIWREVMLGLDYLKQLILYFDWTSGDEITINRYMRHEITKNHIDHSTIYFIEYVISQLNEVRLKIKYPDRVLHTISKEESIMTDDGDQKEIEDFLSRQHAELRYSRDIFVGFLREIRLLGNRGTKISKHYRYKNLITNSVDENVPACGALGTTTFLDECAVNQTIRF